MTRIIISVSYLSSPVPSKSWVAFKSQIYNSTKQQQQQQQHSPVMWPEGYLSGMGTIAAVSSQKSGPAGSP